MYKIWRPPACARRPPPPANDLASSPALGPRGDTPSLRRGSGFHPASPHRNHLPDHDHRRMGKPVFFRHLRQPRHHPHGHPLMRQTAMLDDRRRHLSQPLLYISIGNLPELLHPHIDHYRAPALHRQPEVGRKRPILLRTRKHPDPIAHPPVRQRDATKPRSLHTRDARNISHFQTELPGHENLLETPTENKRITALQPDDSPPATRLFFDQRMDHLLRRR